MAIDSDKVVTIAYRLLDSEGNVLEVASAKEPLAYLHGHANIFPALEVELAGREVGDKLSVKLQADQAYGQRRENAIERVPVKYLGRTGKGKLRTGSVVRYRADDEIIEGTVVKLGKFAADVDTNHPLAGQDLQFDIRVIDVRDASAEEIAHGHAHGPGGHHHH